MKHYNLDIKNIIGFLLFLFIFVSSIVIFISMNTSSLPANKYPKNSIIKKVNIASIINEYKENNGELEYETSNIDEITSLIFKEENRYKGIYLNNYTGKELTFKNLIKEKEWEHFLKKEEELLRLKYPSFIVDGILNTEGNKFYYVKDNELIIYYYDYTFSYDYPEEITLKIDYNEIKDYIDFTPVYNDSYQKEDGYNYDSNKKTVALSFDDGPSKTYNSKILEVLADNKAHASFFMVGTMMNACNQCVINTYKSGNEIGSHTYEHMNIKKNSIEKVSESLNKVDTIYNRLTGDHIKLLRPPYGAYNSTNLENIDKAFILWNLDTEDWRYRNVEHIVEYIKNNVKDGSIILMHELYESSYESLKIILPWLYANGYQIVSVSELASLKGRTLENHNAYVYLR